MAVIVTNIIAIAAAQQQAAREAVLEQLRDAGATSRSTPAPLALDSEEAETALSELIESGLVSETDSGRYYINDKAAPPAAVHSGFVVLLVLLVIVSAGVSAIALLSGR